MVRPGIGRCSRAIRQYRIDPVDSRRAVKQELHGLPAQVPTVHIERSIAVDSRAGGRHRNKACPTSVIGAPQYEAAASKLAKVCSALVIAVLNAAKISSAATPGVALNTIVIGSMVFSAVNPNAVLRLVSAVLTWLDAMAAICAGVNVPNVVPGVVTPKTLAVSKSVNGVILMVPAASASD